MKRMKMLENQTFYVGKIFFMYYNVCTGMYKEEFVMRALYERIKEARTELHLSQDYVAKFLGVNRTAIVEIESGKRKVSADELGKFSELFQIPADELLNGRNTEMPVQMFARRFGTLDEADQQEILNLIEFKRMMKERM